MWALPLTIAILILGLIYLQRKHYEFILRGKDHAQYLLMSGEFEKRLKEFDEYKKRVDALTLRAGFKL